jgi:hypothetical protein
VAHRKKKIGAQLVEDEEYQLRYERVAGIDVAKGKADVCTRLPPAREGGRRVSRTEEVAATVTVILALAVRLLADGVELVSMESTSDYWRIWFYVLEAAGLNVQLVNSSLSEILCGGVVDRSVSAGHRGWPEPRGGQDDHARECGGRSRGSRGGNLRGGSGRR